MAYFCMGQEGLTLQISEPVNAICGSGEEEGELRVKEKMADGGAAYILGPQVELMCRMTS